MRLPGLYVVLALFSLLLGCQKSVYIDQQASSQLVFYDAIHENETAACIDISDDASVDSVKKAHVKYSDKYTVQAIACDGYNGIWHTHPKGDLVMSRADYDYATNNQLLYMVISLPNGFTGIWYIPDVAQNKSNRYRPNYVFNLNDYTK